MKGTRLLRIACVSLLVLPVRGAAQQPPPEYPNVNRSLVIAPGDTVRLVIRSVNEGGPAMRWPGRRVDFVYFTRIPSSDPGARRAQADRAAQLLGAEAIELGINRLSIGICETSACAQRRDPPAEWYMYERTNRGWKRIGS